MRSAIHRPLLALGLAAVLAACSGADTGPAVATLEDPGASASPVASTAPTDPQEAFLAFAQCMRDNGIDMPDPEIVDDVGGGNVGMAFKVGGDAGSVDKEEFRAADGACKHYLANVISDTTTGGISPEDEDKLLAFTHCMREHGIDMPDPTDERRHRRRGAGHRSKARPERPGLPGGPGSLRRTAAGQDRGRRCSGRGDAAQWRWRGRAGKAHQVAGDQ
jgi:hypothetical protein